SERATDAYEEARGAIREFINAAHAHEIIFVRGTTEAINLVAQTYGRVHVGAGDEVVVSAMEHHSNIVPWQMLCEQKGPRLRVIPIRDAGDVVRVAYAAPQKRGRGMVVCRPPSTPPGPITPVREISRLAHRRNIPVLVDAAQAMAHMTVDVQALGCDFYAFS